jgi:hypothetical protein
MAIAGVRPSPEARAGAEGGDATLAVRRFAPLIGSEFRLAGSSSSLTLVGVEDLPLRGPESIASARAVDCSLLRFSATGSADFTEGTYHLVNEQRGDYELHLAPGRPGRYLAYFCTLREPA